MSILDARDLNPGAELRSEICIVGAGAAGITLAVELARRGHDVCLVESGGFRLEEDIQGLNDVESVGYPVRENFVSRARYFGGSCNLWAGRCMRLEESDLASHDGVPGGRWPIDYTQLAEYYPRAAAILGLPALERFERGGYTTAMSREERRLFSLNPLLSTVSLWAKYPMRFGSAYRSQIRRSPRIRLVVYANVTSIRLNTDGTAVESLDAAILDGKRLVFRAGVYVLACGGLENARLLLVSRDVQAGGVGNAFDLVGRYLMDHPRAVFGRVRLFPTAQLRFVGGRPLPDGKVQLGVGVAASARQREGLPNHYATLEAAVSEYTEATYESFIRTMKVLLRRGYTGQRWDVGRARLGHIQGMIYLLTPKEIVPHFVYRWYTAIREKAAPRRGGERVVVYFCEQTPDPESRVTLSSERDRLGMNKLVLNWRVGAEVTRGVLRLQELLRDRLQTAGVGELVAGAGEPRYTDASHHMGTARMGATPRTGVVDAECQVHGIHNLFIAGSSVFPSAGHANPTLTLLALTLRLAARLHRCQQW